MAEDTPYPLVFGETSRLAVASIILAAAALFAFSVSLVPHIWALDPDWGLPLAAIVFAMPCVSLGCGSVALGRIRRAGERLGGETLARIALFLTFFELLFEARILEGPESTASDVLGCVGFVAVVLIYAYALWPSRRKR